jgi:hypothetical protein
MTTTPTTTTTSGTSTSTETYSTTFATTTLTTETDTQGNIVYPVWEIILYLIGSGIGNYTDSDLVAVGFVSALIASVCLLAFFFVQKKRNSWLPL